MGERRLCSTPARMHVCEGHAGRPARTNACTCTCTWHVHVHMHVYMHTHMRTRARTYACACVHVLHMHMHMCIDLLDRSADLARSIEISVESRRALCPPLRAGGGVGFPPLPPLPPSPPSLCSVPPSAAALCRLRSTPRIRALGTWKAAWPREWHVHGHVHGHVHVHVHGHGHVPCAMCMCRAPCGCAWPPDRASAPLEPPRPGRCGCPAPWRS